MNPDNNAVDRPGPPCFSILWVKFTISISGLVKNNLSVDRHLLIAIVLTDNCRPSLNILEVINGHRAVTEGKASAFYFIVTFGTATAVNMLCHNLVRFI